MDAEHQWLWSDISADCRSTRLEKDEEKRAAKNNYFKKPKKRRADVRITFLVGHITMIHSERLRSSLRCRVHIALVHTYKSAFM